MARKSYGTTLWGKEFLTSIENKTDDGRLSRGKTYANTGKIYDVNFSQNTIIAKVVGNYSPFYKTSLTFTPFTKGDNKIIIEFIDNNPFVLADIILGKLPSSLLIFMYENEINIFHGFKMNCNCYDFYGNYPCKHIAALYYVLTNEIDKNPFILFKLRGLDLIEHYGIKEELQIPYPLDLNYTNNQDFQPLLNNISILKQTNQTNFILSMLGDFPPFSHINYKEVMGEFYKKANKELPLVISPIRNEEIEKMMRILQNANITPIGINSAIGMTQFKIESELLQTSDNLALFDKYRFSFNEEQLFIEPITLFNLFASFEDDNGSSSYKYLFYLFRVAYILIENSGFIPAVVEDDGHMEIIYKPLQCIESIAKQIEILSQSSPIIANINDKYLDANSGTNYILSAILTAFVPKLKFMHKQEKNNPPLISLTFFSGQLLKTKNFEYANIAYSIANYFSVFDIAKSNYKYQISIDGDVGNYTFAIVITNKITGEEYSLQKSLMLESKVEIVKFLSFLAGFLPKIQTLLTQPTIAFEQKELEEFLLKTSLIISNLGVEIILPKELKNLLRPKLTLSAKSTSKSFKSFFTLDGMLEYDWQIAIGDELISASEFEELLKSGKELLQFKENYLIITPEEAKAIFSQINRKTKLSTFELLQAKLNDEAFLSKDLELYFEDIFTPKRIALPTSLNANLREYQQRGFEWNINNLLNGFGSILADDMGLGKTIQTIASILYLKENNHIKNKIVVVVPTTLLSNWEKELDKFAPSLSYFSFYGAKRKMMDADITLTTYDLIRRDIESFKKEKIDCLVIDEAQKIKNPDTNITQAIKSLKAKYKIALSGTPVENNLSELWSIFDFSLPKYLKSLKDFTTTYAKNIEIHKDSEKIEKLKKITAPFMLRRLKTNKDIICDLPDKIIIDEYATMTKEQASLYQSVVDETMKQIDEKDSKGVIFKLIIALKQICNHPRNFDKTSKLSAGLSGKTELLLTLLDTIMVSDEKVLIFTQYTQMADILVELIQKELLTTPLLLKGDMSKQQREAVVEKFQNDNRYKIFILSLKAGGVGLNLTAANHVIHYDLWFNPAVENQATDRAFRIGQTKKVTVHRLITKNSFEEKIDKMIKSKQELSDLSVNIGENWLKDMDKEELMEIFAI
jgi:SNF2 family DNA or RNA helicase/uncharacterized Zn finger protein